MLYRKREGKNGRVRNGFQVASRDREANRRNVIFDISYTYMCASRFRIGRWNGCRRYQRHVTVKSIELFFRTARLNAAPACPYLLIADTTIGRFARATVHCALRTLISPQVGYFTVIGHRIQVCAKFRQLLAGSAATRSGSATVLPLTLIIFTSKWEALSSGIFCAVLWGFCGNRLERARTSMR